MAAVCINRHPPPPPPPSPPSPSSSTTSSSSNSLHSTTPPSSRILSGGGTVSVRTAVSSPSPQPATNHHHHHNHHVNTPAHHQVSTMNAAGEETAHSSAGTATNEKQQPSAQQLSHNCSPSTAVLKNQADDDEDGIVIVYGRSMSSPASVPIANTATPTTTTSNSTTASTPSTFSSLPPYSPPTAANSFHNSSSTSCHCSSSLSTLNSSFSSSSSSSNTSSPTPTILCYAPTAILSYHNSTSSDVHHPYHHPYQQQQQSKFAPCSPPPPVISECSAENQEEQEMPMNRSISLQEASASSTTMTPNQSSSNLCALPPSVVISDHSLDEVVVIHHHLHHDHYSTDHQFPYYINGLSGSGGSAGQGHCADDGNLFGNGSGDVQRRRDSLASICSSTSSLSSLGEDDIYFEGTCSGDASGGGPDGSLNATSVQTSPWRKVRSLVTSPFIQTYKRQKYPWIQLAGHQGNFLAGQMQGTILKKKSGNEDKCFQALMEDELRHFVPHFKNVVHMNGESYIELEDLLASFSNPSIMDIKMGIRTYLEEELIKAGEKPKLRKDMYEKMVAIDPREPTEEEHALRAVTKPRYMVWRESISSTSTLGFRIDGVKLRQNAAAVAAAAAAGNGNSAECENNRTNKDFKRTKTEQSVSSAILQFAEEKPECIEKYLNKLRLIRETMARSEFFRSHEMIGSSLLFVHDDTHADIWLIDFAKTYPLPAGVSISHRDQWTLGNHEDGYLTGLDNLIRLFSALQSSNA